MTAYQVAPGLTPEEYGALRADIKANGIRVPVDVDENGQILDGHHRSLIAAELGVDCPRRELLDLTETEKIAHAIAVNVHRRSLTREQRRDLLAASIKSAPDLSDREHARRVGVSDKTAGSVRDELESTAEIPQLSARRGGDGKQRPATQPARVVHSMTTTEKTTETVGVDTETGEILTSDDWQAANEVPTNPIAAARAEAMNAPVQIASKALDHLRRARLTFAAAGTAEEIAGDFFDDDDGLRESFCLELDKAGRVIDDLLRAIRRTSLRSVK